MRRKVAAVFLASAMVFSLAACGGSDGSTETKEDAGTEKDNAEAASGDDNTLTAWCWDPNFNIYAIEKLSLIHI